MWKPGTWKTDEDVLTDLRILSKVPESTENIPIPESILKYRRQMQQNKMCTLNSDIDETASYVVSGRGKGIRDRVLRPGGTIDFHPSDDTELKKQIRQVAGFGYSNELIERSIKAKGYDPETRPNTNSNFKLVLTSSRSSSDSRSPSKKHRSSSSGSNAKNSRDESN